MSHQKIIENHCQPRISMHDLTDEKHRNNTKMVKKTEKSLPEVVTFFLPMGSIYFLEQTTACHDRLSPDAPCYITGAISTGRMAPVYW